MSTNCSIPAASVRSLATGCHGPFGSARSTRTSASRATVDHEIRTPEASAETVAGIVVTAVVPSEVFSATDYLTTVQFFDFGKGSAMGIVFLIMVSVIITIFFKQMRKTLG